MPDQNNTLRHLLTTEQAAERLGMSASWLNKSRLTGDGPAFMSFGKAVRYHPEDLERYAAARRRTSTSNAGDSGSAG